MKQLFVSALIAGSMLGGCVVRARHPGVVVRPAPVVVMRPAPVVVAQPVVQPTTVVVAQ